MAFLREPQVIFAAKHAVMFCMPPPEDTVALHEPLERMRAIVGNVMQCLQAALPDSSWQHRFRVWALPYVADERSKGIRERKFLHILGKLGIVIRVLLSANSCRFYLGPKSIAKTACRFASVGLSPRVSSPSCVAPELQ